MVGCPEAVQGCSAQLHNALFRPQGNPSMGRHQHAPCCFLQRLGHLLATVQDKACEHAGRKALGLS